MGAGLSRHEHVNSHLTKPARRRPAKPPLTWVEGAYLLTALVTKRHRHATRCPLTAAGRLA
jgi:hypothetical protein